MTDERTVEECRHCGCEWVCPECDGAPGVRAMAAPKPRDWVIFIWGIATGAFIARLLLLLVPS